MKDEAPVELVVDVGNSRMKLGLFLKGRLFGSRHSGLDDLQAVHDLLNGRVPVRIGMGSVAGGRPDLAASLRRIAPVTVFTGASPAPVQTRYADPATLGVDRLANVVGAAALFPGRAALVIDLGSCATYDLVDELAVHHGGAISPGLRMRARAMHAYSANLPEAEVPEDVPLTGTDTAASLAAGIHHGLLMEAQGMARAYGQRHADLVVVLTGGDAPRFARAMKSGIFAHPTLTLLGLHALLHYAPDNGPAGPA